MAWVRETVRVEGGPAVTARVNRSGGDVRLTVRCEDHRVRVGMSVELADGAYRIVTAHDPGGRGEILECELAHTPAPKSKRERR